MLDPLTRERLAGRIRAAALDRTLWPAVMAALHDATPGIAVHLFGQADPWEIPLFTIEAGYDPGRIEAYEAYYGALNVWAPTFMSHPAGSLLHSAQMCPDEDLERTEFYNDWVRPQEDICGGGGAVIDQSPGATLLMGGNIRRRDRDRLEDDWMRLCAWVLPRLQHAWRVNCRLAEAGLAAGRLGGRAPSAVARVVIDVAGRVRHVDAAAATLLESAEGPIRLDLRGRVRSGAPALGRMLERARREGSATQVFEHHGRAWWAAAERVQEEDHADWALAPAMGLTGRSLVLLIAPETPTRDPVARVSCALGLPVAETEVAIALAEGLSPREIAERRGVSVHTVRDQIKSACLRIAVRRQLDLAVQVTRVLERPDGPPGPSSFDG